MLNRKELFHHDLPSEEAKAANATTNSEARQPTENNNTENRFVRNTRPRILSNDFVGTQNPAGSNLRNLINEGANSTNMNRRGGSQKNETCKTVKIVKGKSLTIKSEKEVLDGKYKETKSGINKDQNNKGANESDGSSDSNKQIKLNKELAGADYDFKSKTLLPGSSCHK